ncbi:alpha/beta hydrolase [Muricoccus radiodurans]|uniref:alpha/beta hydrolase n=1 Tax=Muricoccus radiodurans TaxID=2231721 RepID=UPI003CE73DAF
MDAESEFHPDMAPMIATRRKMPPAKTPAEMKEAWKFYSGAMTIPRPAEIRTEDRKIPTADHEVPVRFYYPPGATGPLPFLMYMHGGGWMMGDLDSSDTQAWGLCQGTGAIVVSVDYRLTPDHPYPAAFNDCYGVLEWIGKHGAEVGGDPSRIAVCGESAGGNLTAAVVLAARDRNGPAVRAQAIIYGCTGEDPTLPSYVEHGENISLTTARMKMFSDLYFSGSKYADDPYAAPAKAKDFTNLPPAFVHHAECDPLRDDGRHYASKLALAGNDVTYREPKRMLHGFLRVWRDGPTVHQEYLALCDFLKKHLA